MKEILENNEWVVECESPLEIRHNDGNFATMQAAQIVLDSLSNENIEDLPDDSEYTFTDFEVECIEDQVEEHNGNELLAIEEYVESDLRTYFEMNDWDEPEYYERVFNYKGNKYSVEIEEDGCCEATHDGRIMYWKHKIIKL